MSENDDYIDSLERQFPQEHIGVSQSSATSSKAKGYGAKIVVMLLFGFVALALLMYVIKEFALVFVGLAALGILIRLFTGAQE